MFQRLDKMRKQAFGSVCVFGENNNSSISGLFVWRGPGLAFEVSLDDNQTWLHHAFKIFHSLLCIVMSCTALRPLMLFDGEIPLTVLIYIITNGMFCFWQLTPDWQVDYEVYSWEKLDPESEDTKKKVEQYFSWTGADKDGRAFNQGKIFK